MLSTKRAGANWRWCWSLDTVKEPGFGDVYEIGVLVRLLELERLPDGTMFGNKVGAMKIGARAHGPTSTRTDHRRTRTRL
jgi:hypothetical protein